MKKIVWLLLLLPFFGTAQKLKKADKATFNNLKKHIEFLADDRLEGRRTGSNGEKLAYEYISGEFASIGLLAKGDKGTFLQSFEVNDGKKINAGTLIIINSIDLKLEEDFFPFPFSPNAGSEAITAVSLNEKGSPWFVDLKELIQSNANNPHFDWIEGIKEKAKEIADKGATALMVYNSSTTGDEPTFDAKMKGETTTIPVFYLTRKAVDKCLKDHSATLDIKFKTDLAPKIRYGHNVIGYIDNNAPNTIIVGAHYDHLGYGEDKNSTYTGSTPMVHNGADDNASGTAALIEMGRKLKASKFRQNNYVFIAFSGEELGLFGSKYFVENPTFNFKTANYMINMDMVGRLNDSSRALTVGGYGTSPVWGELIKPNNGSLTIKVDSSGSGPSDHTSFYRKDIPVLFFFTGVHHDYHKPSDDADKINYSGTLEIVKYAYDLIEQTGNKGKLSFTKTREPINTGKSNFKVTLGIMPDYTFSGNGVRADGVTEGRPAAKAGLQAGDIILQLGDFVCSDVQAYMTALSKFKKGDKTIVKYQRGNDVVEATVTF
ncbi:MAG: M20/M25/M40 family metallo-hydrolase [Ferruginibacter sp.]